MNSQKVKKKLSFRTHVRNLVIQPIGIIKISPVGRNDIIAIPTFCELISFDGVAKSGGMAGTAGEKEHAGGRRNAFLGPLITYRPSQKKRPELIPAFFLLCTRHGSG
jgi:hypothetical protein